MLSRNHALFVCSANLQRSPTAEDLFRDWRGEWETRSAGTMPSITRQPLTQELIDWADIIIVMEPHHADYIRSNFKTDQKEIEILDIPDVYFRDDPDLIVELKKRVIPILTSHTCG